MTFTQRCAHGRIWVQCWECNTWHGNATVLPSWQFSEPDEPVEKVVEAFDNGIQGITGPPSVMDLLKRAEWHTAFAIGAYCGGDKNGDVSRALSRIARLLQHALSLGSEGAPDRKAGGADEPGVGSAFSGPSDPEAPVLTSPSEPGESTASTGFTESGKVDE